MTCGRCIFRVLLYYNNPCAGGVSLAGSWDPHRRLLPAPAAGGGWGGGDADSRCVSTVEGGARGMGIEEWLYTGYIRPTFVFRRILAWHFEQGGFAIVMIVIDSKGFSEQWTFSFYSMFYLFQWNDLNFSVWTSSLPSTIASSFRLASIFDVCVSVQWLLRMRGEVEKGQRDTSFIGLGS